MKIMTNTANTKPKQRKARTTPRLSMRTRMAKKEMQEVIAAKANIDHLLGLTDGRKNKEMER